MQLKFKISIKLTKKIKITNRIVFLRDQNKTKINKKTKIKLEKKN